MGEAFLVRRGSGANLKGRQVISFFVQETEPTPKKVGDVWVKTNEILMKDNIILSETEPENAKDRQIWQRIVGLDYTLSLEHVSAFFGRNEGELHVEIDSKTIIESIPEDKVLLWENVYSKAFGHLNGTHYWDFATNKWVKVEAYMWNGLSWVQISSMSFVIYDSGVMYVPLVRGYVNNIGGVSAFVNFGSNEILLFAEGAGAEASVVTDYPLDITGHQAVSVTWRNESTYYERVAALVVSKNKLGNYADHEAGIIIRNQRLDNTVTKLDISDLTGFYYIRVHNRSPVSLTSHQLFIKNITLE